MGSNPEPHDIIVLANTERPVPQSKTYRENGTAQVNLLELKAPMEWIDPKDAVGSPRHPLDLCRQPSIRLPEALVRVGVQISSGSTGLVRSAR